MTLPVSSFDHFRVVVDELRQSVDSLQAVLDRGPEGSSPDEVRQAGNAVEDALSGLWGPAWWREPGAQPRRS